MLTRCCWSLVELVSCLLDPPERDAVRGDLAECGAGACRTLGEVIGLVVRRQAAHWVDWRPWLSQSLERSGLDPDLFQVMLEMPYVVSGDEFERDITI